MRYGGPICSICTRDWDERLGYCENCDSADSPATGERRPATGGSGMLEDNFS